MSSQSHLIKIFSIAFAIICCAPLLIAANSSLDRALEPSYCIDSAGTYALTDVLHPKKTGAANYTFHFIPVDGTEGDKKSITVSDSVSLLTRELELRYGGKYEVVVDASFRVSDDQLQEIHGENIKIINVVAQPEVRVKRDQRRDYPAILGCVFLYASLKVPGALNYSVEFTEINMNTKSSIGTPFEVHTDTCSPYLKLNFKEPQPIKFGGRCYRVRWRANFAYGQGEYGIADEIFCGAHHADFPDEYEYPENDTVIYLLANVYIFPSGFVLEQNKNLSIINKSTEQVKVSIKLRDSNRVVVYSNSFLLEPDKPVQIEGSRNWNNGYYWLDKSIVGWSDEEMVNLVHDNP